MPPLVLASGNEPSTPPAGEVDVYLGSDKRLRAKNDDGSLTRIGNDHPPRNVLVNGGFRFFQRQAPASLTTYSSTSGRAYGPDRWGLTNENASVQVRRVDTLGAFETGLASRYYCEVKKITSAGKVVLSQAVEADHIAQLRGRAVRFQFKAKNSVGSHTLRCALLALASPGTADTIPVTFLSAFGANGADPTWGSNLAAVAPLRAGKNSTISGGGLSSTLNSSWRSYGGVFVVPTTALNLVPVIFSNAKMAADDIIHVGDVGLFDGEDERDFSFDYSEELARCLRYYHKTFDVDTQPAQNVGSVTGCIRWTAATAGAVAQRSPSFEHPVRMRVPPSATTYNPLAANAQARDVQVGGDTSALAMQSLTDRVYAIQVTGHTSTSGGNVLAVHAAFDAEL